MKRALPVALLSTIRDIRLYLPEKVSMVAQEGRSSWSLFVVRRSSFVVRYVFDNSIYNYYQSILSINFIPYPTINQPCLTLQTGYEP